ncbi:Exopolysaccharide phosphotransferase [Diplonema papillatum]|nr:Exopolysaccharide phosphotransferase [Diplonema papillatum]
MTSRYVENKKLIHAATAINASRRPKKSSKYLAFVMLTCLLVMYMMANAAKLSQFVANETLPSATVYSTERPSRRSRLRVTDPYWEQYRNVSVVFTWVNGSDPRFRELRAEHGKKGSESRYRDSEELLHAIRSVATYMPWHTGLIFLVTPGHYPYWLNRSHPRVVLVDQNDIIQQDAQPAFNSAVVEQNLWKIKGLTDVFVHFNDDYLLGRPTHPSDFITDDGGVRLYHEANIINGGEKDYRRLKGLREKQWLGSVYHTVGILNKKFGSRKRRFVKHAPFVYSRRAFEVMSELFESELEAASKMRFRNHDDVLIPFLHHNFVIERGKEYGISHSNHVGQQNLDSMLCTVKNSWYNAHQKMTQHLQSPHMFFTVNDGFSSGDAIELVRSFLHHSNPFPSEFEVPDAVPLDRTDVAKWSNDYDVMRSRCKLAADKRLTFDDSAGNVSEIVTAKMTRRAEFIEWREARKERKATDLLACPKDCSNNGVCTDSGCVCHATWLGMACDYKADSAALKTWEVVPACEAFDVVFTWVNGSDPTLLRDLMHYSTAKVDIATSRTRDLGQLRYNLRSIRQYMPWVRHIWVVSGTPKPHWLNDDHPMISYIPHSAIFAAGERPQLNSNSIQARLWAIPNLAYRFLSMDDDISITRPTPPSAMLGPELKGTKQFYRGTFKASSHKKGPYRESLERTEKLMKAYHHRPVQFRSPAHTPPVFDRFVYEELLLEFREEFDALPASRFRAGTDFEPNFGYAWFLQGTQRDGRPLRAVAAAVQNDSAAADSFHQSWNHRDVPMVDLLCRVASSHPTKWSVEQGKTIRERFGDECIDRMLSGTSQLSAQCSSMLVSELSAASLTWEESDKGESIFVMLRETTDIDSLKSRLTNGRTRTACLNDDYPDDVSDEDVQKLVKLIEGLFPDPAPWETDA